MAGASRPVPRPAGPGYNGGMRAFGFSAPLIVLVIQLGVWSTASSQNLFPFVEDPEVFGEAFAQTERLPRFEVEVLAFAYNEFDPAEEQFRGHSGPGLGDAQRAEPVAPPGAVASRAADRYRPLHPPPLPRSAAGPARPFGTETDNGLEPGLRPGPPPGQVAEEALSVSQRILSRLLVVEEASEPLEQLTPADALMPADSLDPATPRDAMPDPLDGLPPQPGPEPEPLAVIAVEQDFGQFGSLQRGRLGASAEGPPEFRFLSREELELRPAAARLGRLDAYTVLVHGGWVQEGLPEERARPFSIGLLGRFNPLGSVQLHLSRFLHVTVALDYRATPPGPAAVRPPLPAHNAVLEEYSLPPVYQLRATRRTRSGEVHYFDHPAFGLLVVVRLAPEAAEAPQDTEGALSPPLGPAA